MHLLRRSIILLILSFLMLSNSEKCSAMVTANILQRVLFIRCGSSTGSAFTIEVDGRQYLITAKHMIPECAPVRSISLDIFTNGSWKSIDAIPIPVTPVGVDIAVLTVPQLLSPINLPIRLGLKDSFLSQEVYFLGYPYGLSINGKSLNNGLPLPLVKRAIISAFDLSDGSQRILLDGHNNPGFSGGPVVRVDADQTQVVIGVISGYEFEQQIVQQSGKDTDLSISTNTGIIVAYPLESALEAIKRSPIGFPVSKP